MVIFSKIFVRYSTLLLLFFSLINVAWFQVYSSISRISKSIDVIKLSSMEQRLKGKNSIELVGDVEILIDSEMHIRADVVTIDKEKQQICAHAQQDSFVLIQNSDIVLLASNFRFNLATKTGVAQNVKIHYSGSFISAEYAEKKKNYWFVKDSIYTPCHKVDPHWALYAKQAKLYNNYLIKASSVLLYFHTIPLLLIPFILLPLHKESQSGFMIPKFAYDSRLGFWICQEFYYKIAKRFDITLGISWRERKGLLLCNRLRWARDPNSRTFITAQYAKERNAFIEKQESILKGTDEHYWIEGDNFLTLRSGENKFFHTLTRVDFGTDKNIGFHFHNTTQQIEDCFYNAFIMRHPMRSRLINITFDHEKIIRDKFFNLAAEQKQKYVDKLCDKQKNRYENLDKLYVIHEQQDKWEALHVPQLFFNQEYTRYASWHYIYDFFIDYISFKEQFFKNDYINEKLVASQERRECSQGRTMRIYYKGMLEKSFICKGHQFHFVFSPEVQLRSHLKDCTRARHKNIIEERIFSKGAFRLLPQAKIEWSIDEHQFVYNNGNGNIVYHVQPTVYYKFCPSFDQKHWLYTDRWDRTFAHNEFSFFLDNHWYFDATSIDLTICQSYDFSSKKALLPLRRGVDYTHFLPLEIYFQLRRMNMNLTIESEFESANPKLIQLAVNTYISSDFGKLKVGFLYQDKKMQKIREVLSEIPFFMTLDMTIPLSKRAKIFYTGEFYAKENSWRRGGIRPLIHKVYFQYKKHCWSFLFGFEEKHYRQYGKWRHENAFILSINLDTLGSVSGRVRRPILS